MTQHRIVVASNRGPVTFVEERGELVPRRGAGGLVTALTGVVQETGGLWIAAAMTEGDRAHLRRTPDGRLDVADGETKFALRLLAFDPGVYDRAYNTISNRLLWFLHHYLWDLSRAPVLDEETREAWEAYRAVNRAFADAVAEEVRGGDADVLVQDYHLSLVPAALRDGVPEARVAHFHHSPFAGPDYLQLLPEAMRSELLHGLLSADVLGFHTERWARNFLECSRLVEGSDVDGDVVRWRGRTTRVGVYPIAIDVEALTGAAAAPEVERDRAAIEKRVAGRKVLLRIDRVELSKNVLRGFRAFGEMLRRHPEWRGRVVFLALLNPSRSALPEYAAYVGDCLAEAERINAEVGDADWTPIETRIDDDFTEVLAAYRLYDALLVNPLFDGMNLVAKEGPVLNERDGALILSRNAGAFAELGDEAIPVDPLDVAGTAEAIHRALTMPAAERRARAERLRAAVVDVTPASWVQRQLADLAGR